MVLPDKFYDQLCNELIDFAKDFDDYGKLDSDETYKDFSCAIEIDDTHTAYVDLGVTVLAEWQDDSFSHEFGIWEDGYKGYYPSGISVDSIDCLEVQDDYCEDVPFTYDRERIENIELTLNW